MSVSCLTEFHTIDNLITKIDSSAVVFHSLTVTASLNSSLTFYFSGLNQGDTECFLVVLNKSTLKQKYIHLRGLQKEDNCTMSAVEGIPQGLVKEGDTVEIRCQGDGNPPPPFTFNRQQVRRALLSVNVFYMFFYL